MGCRPWLFGLILLLLAGTAYADIVYLKNGNRIEGRIVKADDAKITMQVDSVKIEIARSDVSRVELTQKAPDDPLAKIVEDLMRTTPQPVPQVSETAPSGQEAVPGPPPTPSTATEPPASLDQSESRIAEAFRGFGESWGDILLAVVLMSIPVLALLLWGTSHILGIDEPTIFKSLLVTLIAVGTFLLGYWVFGQLDLRFDELAQVGPFAAVNFLVAVISAGFIHKTSLAKAFLLWIMPLIMLAGLGMSFVMAFGR